MKPDRHVRGMAADLTMGGRSIRAEANLGKSLSKSVRLNPSLQEARLSE